MNPTGRFFPRILLAVLVLGPAASAAEYPAQKISPKAEVRFGDALTDVESRLGMRAQADLSPIARRGEDHVLWAGPVTLKFDNRKLVEIAVRSDFDFRLGLAPWAEPWRNFDAIGSLQITAATKKAEFLTYLAAWQERAARAGARKVERTGLLQAGEYAVTITDDGIIDMIQIAFGPERSAEAGGTWGDGIAINFVPAQSDHLKRKPGTLTGITFSCDEFSTQNRVPVPVPVKRDWEILGKFSPIDVPPAPVSRRSPLHPPQFKRHDIGGEAHLAFVIEVDGNTAQVQYLSATDLAFAEAAIAAVKQWRFTPAMRNGEPVTAAVQISIVFAPPEPASSSSASR
jgi:TonB family protein